MDEKRIIKISFGTVICIFIIIALVLVIGGMYYYYNYIVDSKNINSNNISSNINKKEENYKIDNSEYLGVWQEFSSLRRYLDENGEATIPEQEIIITEITDKTIKFDLIIYRLVSYENITATINGNIVTFETSGSNNGNISGNITLNNDNIVLTITKSENHYLEPDTFIFNVKAENSILQ